jgi:hypothetical protein
VSLERFFAGALLGAIAFVPIAFAAVEARRRLTPAFRASPARVVEAVLGIGTVSILSQLLGTVGAYARVPIVVACAAVGLTATLLLRRWPTSLDVEPPPAPPASRAASWIAGAATGVVVVQWVARSLETLDRGIFRSVDTTWYHLPIAARFVAERSVTAVHYLDGEPLTAFYPAGAEVLDGVAIGLFRDDVVVPLLNLGWLALALTAAWSIGRRLGAGPLALLGAAVVVGTPTLVDSEAGSALTDIVGFALVLSAVAVLLEAERVSTRRPGLGAIAVAAVAAGLAAGSKYTMLVPFGVLTVAVVVVAARGTRIRTGLLWSAVAFVAGGLWYVRNLVVVGNPIPPLDLQLGPLSLPSPPIETYQGAVAEYLGDWNIVKEIYLPGLESAFGSAWPVLLLLAGTGVVGAVLQRDSAVARLAAVVGGVSIVAFLFQPQALGVEGLPFFFHVNLRYVTTALALGTALVAVTPRLARGVTGWCILGALLATLTVTQLNELVWKMPGRYELAGASVVALTAAVVAAGRGVGTMPTGARVAKLGGIAVLGLAAVLGVGLVQRGYQDTRYVALRDEDLYWRRLSRVVDFARDLRDERIALTGVWLQYPLYGRDLTNHVQYLGRRGANGAQSDIETCAELKDALNEGRYDYVVIGRFAYPQPTDKPFPQLRWMQRDLAAEQVVIVEDEAAVFRIRDRLDRASCPSNDVVSRSG